MKPASLDIEHAVIAGILGADPAAGRANLAELIRRCAAPLADWFTSDATRLISHELAAAAMTDGPTNSAAIAGGLAARSRDEAVSLLAGRPARGVRPVNEAGNAMELIGSDVFFTIATTFVASGAFAEHVGTLRNLGIRRRALEVARRYGSRLVNDPASISEAEMRAELLAGLAELEPEATSRTGPVALDRWIADAAAGRNTPLPFPWPLLSRISNATMPGSVVVLAGQPGCGKSWAIMQAALHAIGNGVEVAMLSLEKSAEFWERRCWAMAAGRSELMAPGWVHDHVEQVADLRLRHDGMLHAFSACLSTSPAAGMTLDAVASWACSAMGNGARLVLVDPLSCASPSHPTKLGDESARLMSRLQKSAQDHGAVVILATHPRKVMGPIKALPSLDDICGAAAVQRLADAVLWLAVADDDNANVLGSDGRIISIPCNRTLRVLKQRSGTDTRPCLAMLFNGRTLETVELGISIAEKGKSRKDP